jgi:hypothetical protein
MEEGKVGPRSDAYSLGGVLFEAFTGYTAVPPSRGRVRSPATPAGQ